MSHNLQLDMKSMSNTSFEQLVGSSLALESTTGLVFPRVNQQQPAASISLWLYLKLGSNGLPRVIVSRGSPNDDNNMAFPSLFLGSFSNSIFAHPATEKDYISQWTNSTPRKAIPINTWTHVAAVTHHSNVTIFVDGEFVSSEPCYELPRNSRSPVHIGKSLDFRAGICGLVRDVRIYTHALSLEEIKHIIKSDQPPELFSVAVSDVPRQQLSQHEDGASLYKPLRVPIFAEECEPFKSLAAGILDWRPGCDPLNVAAIPLSSTFLPNKRRVIHCHDMKGGYLEDRFPQGTTTIGYNFHYWKFLDIFVYFAHHRVSIPPVGWTNAAHKHSVQVLGTFIVEWEGGLPDTLLLLENIPFFVEKLVQIAEYYRFDGWFVNIETELPSSEHAKAMREFLRALTIKTHERIRNSLVLWYDSVTDEGKLKWQNRLNDKNKMYFDVCDGIFLNYKWNEEFLKSTAELAGDRRDSVFVGIDIFGRGTYGGGGFSTHVAVELISKYGLSTALFAPGWTYEVLATDEKYEINERKFWTGVTSPPLLSSGVSTVPNNMEESGWKVIAAGGNGWKVEHSDNMRLFITSHDWCTRAQEVSLNETDLFVNCPQLLDYFPVVKIEANFIGGGPKFPDLYRLRVELRDESHLPIDTFDSGIMAAMDKWQKLKFTFSEPHDGKKLRYIYWEDGGRDSENWAGHFGTKIGPSVIHICSTLPANQSNTSIASHLPNNKIKVQVPFSTSFSTGQGHAEGYSDWYNLSLQDIQPSFHNTNEIGSYISGSPLMEGNVELSETAHGGAVFSVCGRLHLGGDDSLHFFRFSLFQFANLLIPDTSSTSSPFFSISFLPLTDHSAVSFILIMEDSPAIILCTSSNAPSYSSFHLPAPYTVLVPDSARQSNKKDEDNTWQQMEFNLHESRGKKLREVQVICHVDPSSSSSPPPRNFTYNLLLGKIGISSPPPASSSPTASTNMEVYPFWSVTNISSSGGDSEAFDFFVSWKNPNNSTNPKTDISVNNQVVGSTLQNCYLIKNVKLEGQPIQIQVQNETARGEKYVWEGEQ